MSVTWSPDSLDQLQAIVDYLAGVRPSLAAALAGRVTARVDLLDGQPLLGAEVPEYRDPPCAKSWSRRTASSTGFSGRVSASASTTAPSNYPAPRRAEPVSFPPRQESAMSTTQLPITPAAPELAPAPAPRRTVKELARRLVEHLPEDATWEHVLARVEVFQMIERGIAEADAGNLVSQEEVERMFGVPR